MDRVVLREILCDYFSLDELQTLCFDLCIDFENLGGENKQSKTRELVAHCERIGRTSELLQAIYRLRPNLSLRDEGRVPSKVEGAVAAPAVARPVNLSFDAVTIGEWPSGWFNSFGFVSDVSAAYEARVVTRPDDGEGTCVLFWNLRASDIEFGSLMQRCPARDLAGKVVQVEAEIRTWQVEQWAGLWLRGDGDIVPDLVFVNMSSRPIRGSTPWQRYAIEAQLPNETFWLNYGIVLVGRGTMWADNFRVTVWTSSGNWVDV